MKRSRYWCFTSYLTETQWGDLFHGDTLSTYLIVGKEKCPTTGRDHRQCYVQLSSQRSLSAIKRIYGQGHYEIAKGTPNENLIYCKKENDWQEWGEPRMIMSGKRTDLDEVKNYAKETTSVSAVAERYFGAFCRYPKAIEKYVFMQKAKLAKKEREAVYVKYVYGPTGTGKTKGAYEELGYEETFKICGKMDWWDGYEGEKNLLIDEYSNNVSCNHLLNLLDRYPLRLAIKGSHTYAQWTKVIITSNLPLEELHPKAHEDQRKALFRRISEVVHLTGEKEADYENNPKSQGGG